MGFNKYIYNIFSSLRSLTTGLKTTMKVFLRAKSTEQYPENRDTLKMFDRFRGRLVMPHDTENHHHCIACGLCQGACPNDTITVNSQTITNEDGKKERVLTSYVYDLGSCMFCQLCVNACPHDAITFDTTFENAVFNRQKLVMQLNHKGSTVVKK